MKSREYIKAEDECRLSCEKPFDHGWFPDFTTSVASKLNYPVREFSFIPLIWFPRVKYYVIFCRSLHVLLTVQAQVFSQARKRQWATARGLFSDFVSLPSVFILQT